MRCAMIFAVVFLAFVIGGVTGATFALWPIDGGGVTVAPKADRLEWRGTL